MAAEITGKIVMDGVESEFRMGADADSLYTQWGAPIPELGRRVVLLHRIAEVFRLFASESLCVECVARTASENDPFGQERLCDQCINEGSCPACCSPDDEEFMTEPPYGVCSECGTDWKQWNGQDWELFRKNNRKNTTPEEAPDVD